MQMSERSREAWAKILANRKAATAERRGKVEAISLNEAIKESVIQDKAKEVPVTKTVANCGQPRCCGRGGPEITIEGPTVLQNGFDMGGYNFGPKIVPPMPCAGALWIPKEQTDYEKRRLARLATHAEGLDQFSAKRPVEESKYCKHGRPRNHCA